MMLTKNGQPVVPSGYRVAATSYAKLEQIADTLRPSLPTVAGSSGLRLDATRILEQTLPNAGYHYASVELKLLNDCAAFTVPMHGLVVLREDVYDGLQRERVFSRSTVVHELSHIHLQHALTLHRGGPPGRHEFFEDSEWQAKALTAALMMPRRACEQAASAFDLAHICGTSQEAASYRLERLTRAGLIQPKKTMPGLFDAPEKTSPAHVGRGRGF